MGKQLNKEKKILEKLGKFHNLKINFIMILFTFLTIGWFIFSIFYLQYQFLNPNWLEVIGGGVFIFCPVILFVSITKEFSKYRIEEDEEKGVKNEKKN